MMPLPHTHRDWCNRAVAVSGHLSARVVLMQESRAAISDCASLPSGFQWLRLNPIGPISLYSSIFVIFMPWHVTAAAELASFCAALLQLFDGAEVAEPKVFRAKYIRESTGLLKGSM